MNLFRLALLGAMNLAETLPPKTLEDPKQSRMLSDLVGGVINVEKFKQASEGEGDIHRLRPFAGEALFAAYSACSHIYVRSFASYSVGGPNPLALAKLHEDDVVQIILKQFLSAAEFESFKNMTFGRISWLQAKFDKKVLSLSNAIINGEQMAADSLQNLQNLQAAFAEAAAVNTKDILETKLSST